jgi:hypothetical protein
MIENETVSEIERGWCDDELHRYVPGINCCVCGQFVGRDGNIEIETFELSLTVASIDGTCAQCMESA